MAMEDDNEPERVVIDRSLVDFDGENVLVAGLTIPLPEVLKKAGPFHRRMWEPVVNAMGFWSALQWPRLNVTIDLTIDPLSLDRSQTDAGIHV